jgi:hypothetical protein
MGDGNPVHAALMRVAQGQEALIERLDTRQTAQAQEGGLDAESRMRLRSIDVQMLRILEEISAGRQETMTELRTDLAGLMRALGEQRNPPRRRTMPLRGDPDPEREG